MIHLDKLLTTNGFGKKKVRVKFVSSWNYKINVRKDQVKFREILILFTYLVLRITENLLQVNII